MDRRVSGSEFHIAGPHSFTEKARVPNCVLVRWMMAALFVDDRSLRRWVSSAENVTSSAKYGGHWQSSVSCHPYISGCRLQYTLVAPHKTI